MDQEKTFAELEAQAQAMINGITAQRNAAMDQCVNFAGTIAILELRIKTLTPAPLPSEPEEASNG